ncbi:hypothetical protein [Chryseobacterium sp.]|uniref:hypothetical protein n=1 Tax=Chryseobacterium sp. TaxID=1871047 RepID=UPI00333FC693
MFRDHCLNKFHSSFLCSYQRHILFEAVLIFGYINGHTNGDDFDFRHNIIANTNTIWIREKGSTRRYKDSDSIFADYTKLAGFGRCPLSNSDATSTDFLEMKNVRTTGTVKGSIGSDLKAGLFKNNL